MIESPTATAFRVDGPESDENDSLYPLDDKDSKGTPAAQEELLIVKQKPITAKIRTTMKHLRAQAGVWSRFRGLPIYILYQFTYMVAANVFAKPFGRNFLPQPIAAVVASLLLCRWDLLWTHTVISTPSTRTWWQRIPQYNTVKQLLMPAGLAAVAHQIAVCVPHDLFRSFGLLAYSDPEKLANAGQETQKHILFQLFIVMAVGVITNFLIVLPAEVTLTRVQASMLPEEEDSIVPFDRSFGGKVVPKVVGGTGAVSMLDAWKTFDYAARIRLVKLYVKIFAIKIATSMLFMGLGAAEVMLVLGKSVRSK